MTYVKICGITNLDHALCALEAGADFLGFVYAPSRRQLSAEMAASIVQRARDAFPPAQRPWQAVGVFANQPLGFVQDAASQCGLDVVQLSGAEPPEYCRQISPPVFKAVHLPPVAGMQYSRYPGSALSILRESCRAARLLLDSGGAGCWGGTGQSFDWGWIGTAAQDCMVAGGLGPDNVSTAIATLRPWGVDVSSGVEIAGRKDPGLIRRFITEARRSDNRETR